MTHEITREWNGKKGLEGGIRVKCSCGYVGGWREASDDYQQTNYNNDRMSHLLSVKGKQ